MKTLLFLLFSHLSVAQTMKMTLSVERVPISTNTPSTKSLQTVLLILETDKIGLITEQDTLALEKTLTIEQPSSNSFVYIYKDVIHNQEYTGKIVRERRSFIIFLTPRPPFNRELYSLIISSL